MPLLYDIQHSFILFRTCERDRGVFKFLNIVFFIFLVNIVYIGVKNLVIYGYVTVGPLITSLLSR